MTSKEALEKIGNYHGKFVVFTIYDLFKEDFDLITQDLKRLEKLEKVIKILKDKLEVNAYYSSKIYYHLNFIDCKDSLTEKEYNLLKEIL